MSSVNTRLKTKTLSQMAQVLDDNSHEQLFHNYKSLEKKSKQLEEQNKKLQKTVKHLKKEQEDKWIDDSYLLAYFKSLSFHVSKVRKDVLFVEPSVSQILKSKTATREANLLDELFLDNVSFALFCVNNYNEIISTYPLNKRTTNGLHWSLLLMNRDERCFYHYDSITNANKESAKEIAMNVNKDYTFKEITAIQQTDSFSCGIHLLVNAKQIVENLLNQPQQTDLFSNKRNLNKTPVLNNLLNNTGESKVNQHGLKIHNNIFFETNKILLNQVNQANIDSKDGDFIKVVKKNRILKTPFKGGDINLSQHNVSMTACTNRFSVLDITNDHEEPHFTEINLNRQNRLDTSRNHERQSKEQKLSIHENDLQNENTETPRKRKKNIVLISDSHGRTLSERLNNTDPDNLRATGIVKPNANIVNVLKNHETLTKNMTKKDYLVVIGGTNDLHHVRCDLTIAEEIEELLKNTHTTNVIVSSIPFRYDVPFVNTKIRQINLNLKRITERYAHSTFMPFNNMKRSDYSYHGLHLNNKGKSKMTHLISNFTNHKRNIPVIVTNRRIKKDKTPTFNDVEYQNNNFLGFNMIRKPDY